MTAVLRDPGLVERLPGADERVFAFLEAWCSARNGALVPRRQDFDPTLVPTLLPFIWIYRFDEAIGDFVCTLAGEEINNAWGESIMRKTLREIIGPDDHTVVLPRWRQTVEVPLIQYGQVAQITSSTDARRVERLIMPLRSDGDSADHIIGFSLYTLGLANLSHVPLIPEKIIQIPCVEI